MAYGLGTQPAMDFVKAGAAYAMPDTNSPAGLPAADVSAKMAPVDWAARLADLIDKFEASEDQSRYSRERAERDVDYFDGKQFTAKDMGELSKRGQPALQMDQIRAKVNYLKGLERQQRTDPRAYPRNPGQDEQDASDATAVLKFVSDINRFDQTRSRVFQDIVAAGWGGVEVVTEGVNSSGNPRIVQRRTAWDRMFWDPYSSEENFSDATYLGLVLWLDREEVVRRWGAEAGDVFHETIAGEIGSTYDDKPKVWTWITQKRQRVRVVQMYYQDEADGTWTFAEFTRGGILKAGPSPWLDQNGEPCHPYAWRSAYVDRDNNRYGEIRAMIDGQDALNKIASKLLHLFTVRQTYGTEKAMGRLTTRQLRQELAKPDGHISLAPGTEWGKNFGIIPTTDLSAGMVQMMAVWQGQMNRSGPSATIMGKGDQDASGRSILAQQQGGTLEAGSLYDTLRDLDHEAHKKSWGLIRQFWTAEEWVRITEDPRTVRFVGLNQMARDPMTGQPMVDPMTGQPVVPKPVAQLDVDITIADAPASHSLQGETFNAFVNLVKVCPELQQMPAEFWIEISDLPQKDKALKRIEEAKQGRGQPNPMQIAAAESELRNQAADTEAKQSKAFRDRVEGERVVLESHLGSLAAMGGGMPMQQPQPPQGGQVIPFPA